MKKNNVKVLQQTYILDSLDPLYGTFSPKGMNRNIQWKFTLGLGFGDSVVTAVFKMELLELICKKKKKKLAKYCSSRVGTTS